MEKIKILLISLFSVFTVYCLGHKPGGVRILPLSAGEKVWVGFIDDGDKMPLKEGYSLDFYGDNAGNQSQPFLITNKGQFVWSENPFSIKLNNNELEITDPYNTVEIGKHGSILADVQGYVRRKYFPFTGEMPDTLLFSSPQYNTWIELTYNQNQEDILKYAHKIIDNGFPPGVLMIDDSWMEDYGLWRFHPSRFPNPKEMVDELHDLGFKIMLWIVPLVSADQAQIYRELKESKAFLLEKRTEKDTWDSCFKPIMVEWWNGQSAQLDFSNPAAVNWFNEQLDWLASEYGIDGFKFDAGDMHFYSSNSLNKGNLTPNELLGLYSQFGLRYPLNEFRACWKNGGQPLVQRLKDKWHNWSDLQKLIPGMIVEGLSGYPFSCPDMIGGGDWVSFFDPSKIDQDLIVRSAQCHALMPMMQFSVAPWRILDSNHLDAVKKAVLLREKFTPLIMSLAHEAADTGEPILKSMEYRFPNQGFEEVVDQFMLGNYVLVAPVLTPENHRKVMLPLGKWEASNSNIYEGGKTIKVDVPIDELLYFRLIK